MRAFLSLLVLACGFSAASAQSTDLVAPLDRDTLLGSVTSDLVSHFRLDGELQLELLRPWSPPKRTATAWTILISEYPAVPAGTMMLRYRIVADGEFLAEESLIVRANLWRDGWFTRQPVANGETFDAASLEVRRVDQFRDREVLPATVGDRAYIFTRAVPAGRLLTWRDVVRRPLVRKGDLVEVTASEGPLLVTMKALALQNGAAGDMVTVRNPESRRDFSALVVDENHVKVRF
jgi:flagella basal body P-ring formation protein FlgA